MWFITKLRSTTTFGMVNITWSPCRSVHGFIMSASLAAASAGRAAATTSSSLATSSAVLVGTKGL